MPLDPNDNTIYTTQDGVVLKLKPVSQLLIAKRGNEIPVPEPPMAMVPEKDREEPWYGAPSYLKAMREYETRVQELTTNSLFLFGTELISVPDGFPKPEDTSWSDPLEDKAIWGVDAMSIPTDTSSRYVFWLEYIALAREDDLLDVSSAIRSLGGSISQKQVLEAMESFRSADTGTANTGVGAPNRAARRRSRDSK